MTKAFLHAALAASFVLAPTLAEARSSSCFTQSEWQAAHVRILQTELQVAALECANVPQRDYSGQYNTFVTRYHQQLAENGKILTAHFRRVYGKASGSQLDQFVTKVANDASDRSMTSHTFCADSANLFKDALAMDQATFEQAAVQRISDKSQIDGELCSTASASTKKAPAHHAAKKKVVKS